MASTRTRILFFLVPASILVSLLFSRPISAQCERGPFGTQSFQNISIEPNNSFQAEYSTDGLLYNFSGMTAATRPLSVARDSQGRVRIDGSAGKYKTKSPDGEQREVERHIISICDPVTQNSIRLDTVNKTATVQAPHPRSSHLPPRLTPGFEAQQSFCTRMFAMRKAISNARTADLGHKLISGYDAVGLRDSHVPLLPGAEAKPPSGYTDMWCSDDLGALIQQARVLISPSGSHSSETTLQNIGRREPDPQLFQIPPDYTIVERERDGSRAPLLRPFPPPSTPSNHP
jgi:hypothetical protein